ncbi:MAG: polysaccharide biosynthesis protein [Mogibacterium sp.]|nr:polysaccharide biosynthesis protein [Mogibacterium sp.]MBR3376154.1 polysaccharide biosynthesis protein [Mogibacterium sp.]
MREEDTRDNEEKKEGQQTSALLMKGATILVIAGIVSKIFGAIFRIPLTNMIGAEGQAYYSAAYAVYNLLFVIATAGFPVAISRMVSSRIAEGDFLNAHKSYKLAMKVSWALGIISFIVMFFGAGAIASAYKNPGAEASMKAISVALLFTPVVASMRGYYQGRQNMKPTGITEVIEQMMRVAVGLTLAYMFYKTNLQYAAAGATFGASAGIIAALVAMAVIYARDKEPRSKLLEGSVVKAETDKKRLKELFAFLIPITIGASVMPIMFNIDAGIIVRRLLATGWDPVMAKKLYGLMGGFCDPIINLPNIFIDAICISLMPAVTTAFTLNNKKDMDDHIKTGLKTMMIITYPCAIGLIVLAKPILTMLYYRKYDEALLAVPALQILALSIITLSIMRTLQSCLQGIGKMMLPVYNLFIGAIVKAVSSYILLGIPAVNINGAAIGSVLAYVTAGILNFRALKKYTNVSLDMKSIFFRPLVAALIMGAAAIVSYKLLFLITSSNAVSTLVSVMFAAAVYFVSAFLTGAVTKDEIELIPKGDLIYRLAVRLKVAK